MKPKVMDKKHIENSLVNRQIMNEFTVSVKDVNQELAIDCVEEFLEDGQQTIEFYVAWMIEEGYDMEVFS
jgi:hypothetical protein